MTDLRLMTDYQMGCSAGRSDGIREALAIIRAEADKAGAALDRATNGDERTVILGEALAAALLRTGELLAEAEK